MKKQIENWREFALSSLAINNRKTVYLLIAILLIGGVSAYNKMPRESFPQIEIPEIYVNIPYPGNSAEIITDKIIKPFEKELNKFKTAIENKDLEIEKKDQEIEGLIYLKDLQHHG